MRLNNHLVLEAASPLVHEGMPNSDNNKFKVHSRINLNKKSLKAREVRIYIR